MNKIFFLLLLSTSLVLPEWPPKIPEEMQKIIDNYSKDSTQNCGFLSIKNGFSIDKSIKFSDIEVDVPIKEYIVRYYVLDTCSDSIPVRKLIRPCDSWILPIKAHGKFIYTVKIMMKNGKWQLGGCSTIGLVNIWKQIRDAYPISSGITPIFIHDGLNDYLHFPQLGDHNLFYINYGQEHDTLGMITSKSILSPDDSRKIIGYRKEVYSAGKNGRDEMNRKHPGLLKDLDPQGGDDE